MNVSVLIKSSNLFKPINKNCSTLKLKDYSTSDYIVSD